MLNTLHVNFSASFFHTCHGYRQQQFLPLLVSIPLSVVLTLAGVTWSVKSKKLLALFSHTFELNGMKFCVVTNQIKLSILILVLSEINEVQESSCLLTASQN